MTPGNVHDSQPFIGRLKRQVERFDLETVERSFADVKQHHGHRYARFCGLMKVQMQFLLAATAQNMKKMALLAIFCWLLRAVKGLSEGLRMLEGRQNFIMKW